MTTEEFSNEFDVLLNSYAVKEDGVGQGHLELDEYEKSVLLTEAQESIVKDLYNGRLTGDGFEATEEMRRSLDELVLTDVLEPVSGPVPGMSETSQFFNLKKEVWLITYESAHLKDDSLGCKNDTYVEVIPVRQDEYHSIKDNPFRGPSDKRVLRIDTGYSTVELISKYHIEEYFVKYICRPMPIILANITTDSLTINGESEKSEEIAINSILHRPILERAVALAIKRLPSK